MADKNFDIHINTSSTGDGAQKAKADLESLKQTADGAGATDATPELDEAAIQAKADGIIKAFGRVASVVGLAVGAGKFIQEQIIGFAERKRDEFQAEEKIIDGIIREVKETDRKIERARTVEQLLDIEREKNNQIVEAKQKIHREESKRKPNPEIIQGYEREIQAIEQQLGKVQKLTAAARAREEAEALVVSQLEEQVRHLRSQQEIADALIEAKKRIEDSGAVTEGDKAALEQSRNNEARAGLQGEVKKFFATDLKENFRPEEVLELIRSRPGLSAPTTARLAGQAADISESDARLRGFQTRFEEGARNRRASEIAKLNGQETISSADVGPGATNIAQNVLERLKTRPGTSSRLDAEITQKIVDGLSNGDQGGEFAKLAGALDKLGSSMAARDQNMEAGIRAATAAAERAAALAARAIKGNR